MDEDAVFRDPDLRIRHAGVVDVPGRVFAGSAQDGIPVLKVEEVAPADRVRPFRRDKLTPIFHQETTGRDIRGREDAKSGGAAADAEGWVGRAGRGWHMPMARMQYSGVSALIMPIRPAIVEWSAKLLAWQRSA